MKNTPNVQQWYSIAILLLIISAGAWLRHEFMIGLFLFEDDLTYTKRIIEAIDLNLDISMFNFYDYRFLVYIPQAAVDAIFGFSPSFVLGWPFFSSVLHILIVYKISYISFHDNLSALIAAYLMAISPLNILEIRLHPDSIFSFFISTSIYFLIKGSCYESSLKNKINIFLSYLLLLASFFVRENAFFVFPLFLFFPIFYAENKKDFLETFKLFIFTVMLPFIFIIAINENYYGKILEMIEIQKKIKLLNYAGQIKLFPYFNYLVHPLIFGYGMTSIFLFGLSYLHGMNDKKMTLFFLWFSIVYVYFEFVSPFHGLRPAEGSFRYFTPFIPPMAIILGRFFSRWMFIRTEEEKKINFIMLAFIIFSLLVNEKYGIKIQVMLVVIFHALQLAIINKKETKNHFFASIFNIYCAAIIIAVSALTIFYVTTAGEGYDRITLNKITKEIYLDISNKKTGIIACNNFMVERKLNLFKNSKIIENRARDLKNISYVIMIDEKKTMNSYKWKQLNDASFNLLLLEAVESSNFYLEKERKFYKIFRRKEKI